MDTLNKEITPHKQLLDTLFAHKSKVSSIFHDVLGIHELSHIAVSFVNERCELLTFSSTPAMEFNLFNSNLWRFDKSYDLKWVQQCGQAYWQNLYAIERYDELYYLKQIKHRYPLGCTLAAKMDNAFLIYSLASSNNSQATAELYQREYETLYKMGQYCTNQLLPLLEHSNDTAFNRPYQRFQNALI